MFLDEFQHACEPNYNFAIVPLMRHAMESPTCPHFVAVSTFGVLSGELGSPRLLSGQSIRKPLGPMTDYWGAELALRSARYYSADLPEDMAPAVSARCGGNPFYIASVVRRSAKQGKTLADEQTFNEILAVDLSSGFIWEELREQVESWIKRFDDVGVAKWVLYLSAFEKDEWIKPERIRKKLLQREARDVSVESVRDILIKLSRGDLLDYCEMGGWFRKADEPILVDFLRVWGRIAVENNNPVKVRQELIIEYRSLKREIHHRLGYLGGVCMAQVLSNTRRRTIPARFFHTTEDIAVPFYWVYILHRTKLGATPDIELDVEAAAGMEMWICESKWWRSSKAGVKEVESLLYKGRLLREKEGPGLEILRLWFFAHDGFTPDAEALMAEKGVLWSDRTDLNGLLALAGLKQLPDVQ